MNTNVGAELRSRLRARSGSATGCHRQVIHYRPPCGARNFLLATARKISTAARFAPCLLPPQAAARRETPFESLSYQNKRALLRSALLFWQPNRDSNPNIQSQSLLCYRYTIRLYLLLAENSISVCSPVVNSFLQFSKNYA